MKTQKAIAFSLVEVLAAITIIGVVVFLAVPNIIQIREDSEENLATARAASLDVAISSFIQANGRASANTLWSGTNNAGRYNLLLPYLGFAEGSLSAFEPNGYDFTLPASISPPTKTAVSASTN